MTDERRVYRKGDCVYCKEHKFIASQGLCRACYNRNRRNGQLEKVKVKHSCSIDGCNEVIYGQGYCEMHYCRVKRHGDALHNNRPEDWGKREEHPLYQYWTTRRRASAKIAISDKWRSDFWLFCKDVGDRPSQDHFLRLIDVNGIYENGNVEWREKLIVKNKSEIRKDFCKRHQRASRISNPENHQNTTLKKNFGITLVDYNKMNADQNGVCAICGNKETMVNPRHLHGNPQNLSVDHCHETGKIRGLLCSSCNVGLGYFKDNVAFIEKAMQYLLKHKEN